MATLTPAHAAPGALFSPLLTLALVLAGAWAAITAAFARNYDKTTYSAASKGKIFLLWPFLAAFSARFRQQFVSALRGVPVKVTGDGETKLDG